MNDPISKEDMALLQYRIEMTKAYEASFQQGALEAKNRQLETTAANLQHDLIQQRRISYGAVALVAIACILLGMRL